MTKPSVEHAVITTERIDWHFREMPDELKKLMNRNLKSSNLKFGFLDEARELVAEQTSEEYDWVFYDARLIWSWNGLEWKQTKPRFSGRGYRLDMNRDEAFREGGEAHHRAPNVSIILVFDHSQGDKPGETWDYWEQTIYAG
jgi:hypothetical protein